MNNINQQLINDEEYVSVINEISNSIFNYYKALKGNYSIIENNYDLLINKYYNIIEVKNIMKIYLANNENLENFISDMKILFQNLRVVRKQYLNKIAKISTIKNNQNNINLGNYIVIEKNRYFKIMNLLKSLNKYKEIIELYNSEELKHEFTNILMEIINQLEKTDNNINYKINKNANTNNSPQLNNLKNKLKECQRKKIELELKINELLENNKIKQNELIEKDKQLSTLNEELKSIDIKFNDISKENNKNKSTIDNNEKEKILINTSYNKKLNEEKNKIVQLNKELQNKDKEINEIKEKLVENIKDYNIIENKYNELKKQNFLYEQKIDDDKKLINELQNEISNNKLILDKKEKTIENYRIKNEDQKNKINQLTKENTKIIVEKEENYRKIEKQREEQKLKIEEYNKRIDTLNTEKNKVEEINRLLIQEKEKNKKLVENEKNNDMDLKNLQLLLIEEKEKNKILTEQKYLELEQLKIKLNEEKEKNEKLFKEYKNQNEINLEQLKLKTSQIDTFTKTLNEKDELIKKLRNNYMQNEEDKISQYLKDIKELEEKNKNLLKENDELKQSNFLIKSSNQEIIKMNQSKNQLTEKISGIYDIMEKNEKTDSDNNKEIIDELKIENEKLKKQIEELKLGNQVKEEKQNRRKFLYQSDNSDDSDFEEEFDNNYLANTAKKRNNSEDRRIDYQGLNNINEKYEELKKKILEIKEIFKYIISKIKLNEPDLKSKIDRVSNLLNNDFD